MSRPAAPLNKGIGVREEGLGDWHGLWFLGAREIGELLRVLKIHLCIFYFWSIFGAPMKFL